MAIAKLKALNVAREKRPGSYGDGGGLYLQVAAGGAKSCDLPSLGGPNATLQPARSCAIRSLAKSKAAPAKWVSARLPPFRLPRRATALECRKLREKEIDPIEAREAARRAVALERAKFLKFKDAAEAYIAAHRVAWKNDKHAAQWPATLKTYAYPVIGDLPLHLVDTALVMKVIEPIWSTKPETASRLRGRMELVLDWATVRGYRQGDNPARWRGHLEQLLPARAKVRKVWHHSALPYAELPPFLVALREQDGMAARALEFTS